MDLRTRTLIFLQDLELPLTRFCKKVELSRTPLVNWLNGDAQLSTASLDRIDVFISKYGF